MLSDRVCKYTPPEGALEFAEKRTRSLRKHWGDLGCYSLNDLCSWSYLQAVQDIARALDSKQCSPLDFIKHDK